MESDYNVMMERAARQLAELGWHEDNDRLIAALNSILGMFKEEIEQCENPKMAEQ